MMRFLLFFYIAVFLSNCTISQNQEKFTVAILKNQDKKINLQNIEEQKFTTLKHSIVNYDLGLKNIWLKINIDKSYRNNSFLEIGNPLTDSITVFQKNKTWKTYPIGMLTQLKDNPYKVTKNIIPLTLKPEEHNVIYIKISSRINLEIPVNFLTKNELAQKYINEALLFGGLISIVLFLMIIFTVFYVKYQQPIYLYFVIVLLTTLLTHSLINGYFQYFSLSLNPSFYLYIFYIAIFGGVISITLFSSSILELKKYNKVGLLVLELIILGCVITILSLFIVPYLYFAYATLIIIFIFTFSILIVSIHAFFQRKTKVVLAFSFAWLIYLLGVTINFLKTLSILESNWVTKNISLTSVTAQLIILSFGIFFFRKKRQQERDDLILSLSKKINDKESSKSKHLNDYRSLLTKSELKIVVLIGKGYTSKKIAEVLFVSEKTVSNHRYNIIKKLELPKEKNSLIKWVYTQFN